MSGLKGLYLQISLTSLLIFYVFPQTLFAKDTFYKASSKHFEIISNLSESNTKKYITNLELYRYVLTSIYPDKNNEVQRSRFPIYLLKTRHDLRVFWQDINPNIAGFVRFCKDGVIATSVYEENTPLLGKNRQSISPENESQTIIFHEYAHIFMATNTEMNFPFWFIEGFAEYYSTIVFNDDQILIGRVSTSRARELISGSNLKYKTILSSLKRNNHEQFYAKSWLLVHWILSDEQRVKQLALYFEDIRRKKDPAESFVTHFKIPIEKLDSVLYEYMHNSKARIFKFNTMIQPDVSVIKLPQSMEKLTLLEGAVSYCPKKSDEEFITNAITQEQKKWPNDLEQISNEMNRFWIPNCCE